MYFSKGRITLVRKPKEQIKLKYENVDEES